MTNTSTGVAGAPQAGFLALLPYLLVHTTTEGKPIMGRSEYDFDEPDYEAIVERRREYRQADTADRAERSYERYVTGE